MNLRACRALPTNALAATWYRAVQLRFWRSLLAVSHTAIIPGRFNAGNVSRPGFEVLYFAEDHVTALFEVEALLGSPYPGSTYIPNPNTAWTVVNVDLQVGRVAGLTTVANRKTIGTTVQELTGDWRGYVLRNSNARLKAPYWTQAPTQRLGHALHGVRGLEGSITYSARIPTRKILVVFPGKLRPGSRLLFVNPVTGKADEVNPPS